MSRHSWKRRRLGVGLATKLRERMRNVRTSHDSPLKVSEIAVPGTPGAAIGITICPGKQGQSSAEHYWRRNLRIDLDVVSAWGATNVISILQKDEISTLGVHTLGAKIKARNIHWIWLQIEDGGVPGEDFAIIWPPTQRLLCGRLRAGEKVLIHCRGGLGRSGMIAALLLRSFGVSAEEAVQAIRNSRPGAIETEEQERFVLTAPVEPGSSRSEEGAA